MKLLEKICLVLAFVALIMKFNVIPGGSALFLFSILTLAMICFYFSFLIFNSIKLRRIFKKESYKGISGLRLAYVIIAGFSISALLIGIVFKIMYWPGAAINLIACISASLVVLILAVIKYFYKKEDFYRRMIVRFAPSIVIGVFLLLLSRADLVKFQYRNYPQYAKAFLEREEDPTNEEKRIKERLEWDRMSMSEEQFKHYHEEKH